MRVPADFVDVEQDSSEEQEQSPGEIYLSSALADDFDLESSDYGDEEDDSNVQTSSEEDEQQEETK